MKYSFPDVPTHLVSVAHTIPVQYKNYQYPFAQGQLMTAPAAVILEQQITVKGCVISHHWMFVKAPVKLLLQADGKGFTLHCMMQGSTDCRLNGRDKFRLYQGQYNLLQLQQGAHVIHLSPGIYASWATDSPFELLEEMAHGSMHAKQLLQHPQYRAEGTGTPKPFSGIIWNKLYQLIEEINQSTPGRTTTDMQLYGKVLEIQAMVLEDLDNMIDKPYRDANSKLFETIRVYLSNHLDTRPDLAQLARCFCMSQSKLKQGFKKYYAATVWSYHHQQRMERSMQLLLHTSKSVANIAAELGYMPTNFARDFKKFYGYSPRSHRSNGVTFAEKE